MKRFRIDHPGPLVMISGIVLVVVSTGLGFYLASLPIRELPHSDWHYPDYERLEEIRDLAVAQASLVSNVHALMWMTFGLGTVLTLVGLRMLTRRATPFEPEGPIKPLHNIFER